MATEDRLGRMPRRRYTRNSKGGNQTSLRAYKTIRPARRRAAGRSCIDSAGGAGSNVELRLRCISRSGQSSPGPATGQSSTPGTDATAEESRLSHYCLLQVPALCMVLLGAWPLLYCEYASLQWLTKIEGAKMSWCKPCVPSGDVPTRSRANFEPFSIIPNPSRS